MTASDAPVPADTGDERAEVRVEWGVRYRWISSRHDSERLREHLSLHERHARAEVRALLKMPTDYADVTLLRRTVTTSPWEPA